jgi:hypothetical protein
MTWPTAITTPSPMIVATSINAQVIAMVGQVSAWRASINATGQIASDDAQASYGVITSCLAFMNANKGVTGLAAAMRELLSNASAGFDPVAEFSSVSTATSDFVTWFQGAWPKTTGGNPAFVAYDGTTQQLISFKLTLTAGQKTTALAKIDALLAVFS